MAGDDGGATIFKQGSITLVGNVLGRILGLSFFIWIPRIISKEEFGAYTLSVAIVLFVQAFGSLSIDRTLDYFIPQNLNSNDYDKARGVLRTAILLSLPVSLVCAAAIILSTQTIANIFSEPQLVSLLPALSLLVPLITGHKILLALYNGIKNLSYRVITREIIRPAGRVGFAVFLVSSGLGIYGVAVGHVLAIVAAVVVGVLLVTSRTEWIHTGSYSSGDPSTMLRYSIPLAFAGIIYSTVSQIDYFAIGYFGGESASAEVAEYRLAFLLAQNVLLFHMAVKPIFKPMISENLGNTATLQSHYQLAVRWITMTTIPVAVTILLAPESYLGLFFSSKYATAGTVLVVLVCGQFVNVMVGPSGKFIEGIGRTRITFLNTVVLLGTNLILDVLLVPRLGILGAAIATATALSVVGVISLFEVRYLADINPISSTLPRIWLASLLAVCGGYALTRVFGTGLAVILVLPVLIPLLYVTGLRTTGAFTEADRDVAESIDDRIGYEIVSKIVR